MSIFAAIIRFDVGLILLAASLTKVRTPGALVRTIRLLGVPGATAPTLAWAVIGSESIAGLYLMSDSRVAVADAFILTLCANLAAVSLFAIATKRSIVCHCFGNESKRLGLRTLALSGSLGLAVMASLAVRRSEPLVNARLLAGWAVALGLLAAARWVLISSTFLEIWLQRRHLRGLFTQTQEVSPSPQP